MSLVAGDFIKNIPLFGFIVSSGEGIFVPRGGSAEAKQKTVELIEER